MWTHLDRAATRGRILLLGWLLFVIYAFPGYMSTDSVDQLNQARNGPLHDWYPPLMAWLWRWLDSIIAGPFLMLVLQSVTFLLGADGILRRAFAPRAAAVAACGVLLFPPVMSQMAVIWKDSQMAGFLLAGMAGLLSEDRRWRIAGCGWLFLATAQRYNAPAATLPLVLGLFVWRPELPRLRRYAIALAVWIAITGLAFGVNRALTETNRYAWHGSIALLDICGTIRWSGKLTDAELRERLAGVPGVPSEDMWRKFRKKYGNAWFWMQYGDDRVFDSPTTEDERDAVARAWRNLVIAHPFAYLKHRWVIFRDVIGLPPADPQGAVWDGFVEAPEQMAFIKHQASHSSIQGAWVKLLYKFNTALWVRPWAYMLIALALLPLARRNRPALVLLLSGLFNELSLYIVAPSIDYRYSHWMITATVLAGIIVFTERWRLGRSKARGTLSG